MHSRAPFSSQPAPSEILTRLVQEVSAVLESSQLVQTALLIFQETFASARLAFYQADPTRQVLNLLATLPVSEASLSLPALLSYDAQHLATRATQVRSLLLSADPGDLTGTLATSLGDVAGAQQTWRGFCLPLWCGNAFEGCLLATFPTFFAPTPATIQLLSSCALYLATALSRSRLQRTVEQERQSQHTILDHIPEGVLIVESASGSVRYANGAAAQILGVPLHDLSGSTLTVSTPSFRQLAEDAWPRFPWTFAAIRALSGETISQMEAVVLHLQDSPTWVLCSSAPLREDRGMITGAVVVFQDVTQQKKLEAQKDQFFSFASHELRTPLTTVMGYAELLREMTRPEQAVQLDVSAFHRASQHMCVQTEQMVYLIDEMLDLARIDQHQLSLRLLPMDLLPLARAVVEKLAFTTHSHEFRFVPGAWAGKTEGTPLMVLADVLHLSQVLNTLVKNAIIYSPEGGEIEIGVRRRAPTPTHVLVWVRDHGLGIAASDLPHLFTRFYRARNLDRSLSGLGISLYLAKKVVELHGGQIWIESTEGQGATLFFSLPLAPAAEGGVMRKER